MTQENKLMVWIAFDQKLEGLIGSADPANAYTGYKVRFCLKSSIFIQDIKIPGGRWKYIFSI